LRCFLFFNKSRVNRSIAVRLDRKSINQEPNAAEKNNLEIHAEILKKYSSGEQPLNLENRGC
jgi:hypothetical protein